MKDTGVGQPAVKIARETNRIAEYDPTTNHMVTDAVCYDDNGNIIKLFDMNLSFDIENRLVAIENKERIIEHYAYNPANLRIWKMLFTGEEEIHFYGNGGRRLATYKLTIDEKGRSEVSLIDYEMYFAGKLIRSNSKPVVLDYLGNVHAWLDSQNNVQKTKYYPFGEERFVTKNNRKKFGAYIRDEFSGLDYAEQRYYSSALGRFITPDPFEGSVRLGNPETWNRFAYVENDPINSTDPHGLYVHASFSKSAHLVTVLDLSTGALASAGAFSGDSSHDPIPNGLFEILYRGGDSFRLDKCDAHPHDDHDDDTERGRFRLHLGTISWGCITVSNSSQWTAIANLINSTTPKSTVPDMIPIPWYNFWLTSGVPITWYGTLEVLP
jgi:RHS repeat-associated protein